MQKSATTRVLVIGAGLAGSEAAMFLARNGVHVVLIEAKALKLNPAQKIPTFAELVCTNSLKSLDPYSAHGLLKSEMKAMGSFIIQAAEKHAVPAGDALAVDREKFSAEITEQLKAHPLIQVVDLEAANPIELKEKFECQYAIVATGPLTTKALEDWILKEVSGDDFYFYDAIAPVVDADTLDLSKMYFKDRHKEMEEGGDYLNSQMTKEQYYAFIEELKNAEKVQPKEFEDWKFFESCLPIDLMAERGPDTARFSCMKPVGLEPDINGKWPFAVVQLRKENLLGSAYNLVGFQTRLTYKEQVRVFRMIPGLEEASFIHLGSCHRNSFLNARKLLDFDLKSKKFPEVYFAGQITGVEGYTESASMGLYVAFQLLRRIKGEEAIHFPVETAMGALVNYIMTIEKPCPSNINFGLLPSIEFTREMKKAGGKKLKKELVAKRAQEVFQSFFSTLR
ncbi:methylenetetrahydrofolate--tRNA-(uracil(54)-C(5))-methyltransferase (FADH(2)-oxidizing) TrmFO [Peredibacter starrii]|uniref:Methylenetetrahydrofolate--tRNA-(uracil-5-)-methyltransferase TrmFO n=1 Tax=Peredibacter starrii TaxID=28202 RepID=A0AAX4HSC3_9BACT|nr:methylenetetrahydrofolate--tRNA-(uracil(54)-C(5))-methyltransferase (FADH(2)-oxidizing) TrmFO [Peredibacter starrii]WPU66229.1 methylenetetrahydrofolate--tRNA-(uracil(54)-C(5))-methyltransferase (FADH(2)-oxidizing) TrmFO [Peredibacter starrii]